MSGDTSWLATFSFRIALNRLVCGVCVGLGWAVLGNAASAGLLVFGTPTVVPISPSWGDLDSPAKPKVSLDGTALSLKQDTPHQVYTGKWNASTQEFDSITHASALGQSWTSASFLHPVDQWLYYVGSSGIHGDIYRSTWTGAAWGAGVPIAVLNAPFEMSNDPFFNGSRMYFGGATIDDGARQNLDLYYSDYDSGFDSFSAPMIVAGINSMGYEDSSPALTPDGNFLFWHSNRPGGLSGNDIWYASWDSGLQMWTDVTNAGPTINDAGNQEYPSFADGTLFFFDSNNGFVQSTAEVVPEPTSLVLLGIGSMALAGYGWRNRRRRHRMVTARRKT